MSEVQRPAGAPDGDLGALRERAHEAIACKGDGSIAMSRQAGKEMLALIERLDSIASLAQLEGSEFAHRVYVEATRE